MSEFTGKQVKRPGKVYHELVLNLDTRGRELMRADVDALRSALVDSATRR